MKYRVRESGRRNARCLSWRNEEESRLDYLDASRAKGITMVAPEIDSLERGQTVDSVMRQWPSTIRVFLDFRMLCIGCPIGTLHTINEACAAHDVDLNAFS